MSKKRKARGKIALPTDRDGVPIDVGDVIAWDDEDGTVCKVETLTYLGDEFADTIGAWVVNIETDYYDNPQGSEVLRKAVKR